MAIIDVSIVSLSFSPLGHSTRDGTGFIDKQIGLKKQRQLSFRSAPGFSLIAPR
jgi:hypothetical protein